MTVRGVAGAAGVLALVLAGAWWLLDQPLGSEPRGVRDVLEPVAQPGGPLPPQPPAEPRVSETPAELAGALTAGTPSAIVPPPVAAPPPALRLQARIVSPAGQPVAGAEVGLLASPSSDASEILGQASSTGDGRVALEITASGALDGRRAWLRVLQAGSSLSLQPVPALRPGERDLGDVVLVPGAGVRGRVIAPDGAPAQGALVRVRTLKDDGRGQGHKLEHYELAGLDEDVRDAIERLRALRTGADGTFAFAGLHEGEAQLEVDSQSARRVELGGLALAAGAVADVGDVALDEGLVIAGIVLTAAGEPASTASIRVQRERPAAAEPDGTIRRTGQVFADQWTDETGRFRLAGLARGTFELVAWAEDHAYTLVTAQAGDGDVKVRLAPSAIVLLELSDARSGAPILEADISGRADLKLTNGSTLGVGNRLRVRAGEEAQLPPGTWRITGLAQVPTTLLVQAPGYSPAGLDLPPLAPGATYSQRVRLARPLRLSGLVVDGAAQPIVEAVVQIAPSSGPAVGLPTKMTRTDASGAFTLDGLGQGTWQLWAYADGFESQASSPVEFFEEDVSGLALRLVRGATLAGTALTARGDVVPEARVAAWQVRPLAAPNRPVPEATRVIEGEPGRERDESRTEAEGAYQLGPLAPGEYLVAAALPTDASLLQRLRALAAAPLADAPLPADVVRVVLAAGEERALDLLLPRPARVRGIVRAGGTAAPGAQVALLAGPAPNWTLIRTVDADAAGAFEFDGLAPLEGVVLASAAGESLPRVCPVTVAEGSDTVVDLAFQGPGVSGTVLDVARDRPVSDVPVDLRLVTPAETLVDPWHGLWTSLNALRSASNLSTARPTSDAAGRFAVPHLPAGRWIASAYGNGWLAADQATFEVSADWTPDDIVVRVKSGAVVEGSVRWSLGSPADAELELGLYKPVENTVFCFVRASRGRYRLAGLLPGDYELRVRHMVGGGGYVYAQPVTLAEGQHVTIDLVIDD